MVHGAGHDGVATDAQLAAFLIALRLKGETVDEIVGFRDAILEHAVELPVDPWRSTSSAPAATGSAP